MASLINLGLNSTDPIASATGTIWLYADASGVLNTINSSNVKTPLGVVLPVSIANGGTGQTTQAAAINALLPSQSGITSGWVLTTDGTNVSWAAGGGVSGLPFTGGYLSQSGSPTTTPNGETLAVQGTGYSGGTISLYGNAGGPSTALMKITNDSAFSSGTGSYTGVGIQLNPNGFGTGYITGLCDPSNPQDPATKNYVDNLPFGTSCLVDSSGTDGGTYYIPTSTPTFQSTFFLEDNSTLFANFTVVLPRAGESVPGNVFYITFTSGVTNLSVQSDPHSGEIVNGGTVSGLAANQTCIFTKLGNNQFYRIL